MVTCVSFDTAFLVLIILALVSGMVDGIFTRLEGGVMAKFEKRMEEWEAVAKKQNDEQTGLLQYLAHRM